MIWFILIGALFFTGGIANLFSDFDNGLFMMLIGACLICWGLRKQLFPNVFVKKEGSLITETFSLPGVQYYSDRIDKLRIDNPAWKYTAATAAANGMIDKPIYRHNYVNKPVKLIPDPNNPHDKNAVAVYFAGELVGYISRDDNQHVLDILTTKNIKYISGFIGGGEYKVISSDSQTTKGTAHHTVRVKISYV